MANPTWSRDELIVMLDFYLRHDGSIPPDETSEIQNLTTLINELSVKPKTTGTVYQKLIGICRFVPLSIHNRSEHSKDDGDGGFFVFLSENRTLVHELASSITALVKAKEKNSEALFSSTLMLAHYIENFGMLDSKTMLKLVAMKYGIANTEGNSLLSEARRLRDDLLGNG